MSNSSHHNLGVMINMSKSALFIFLGLITLASSPVLASTEPSNSGNSTSRSISIDDAQWALSSSTLPGDPMAAADGALSVPTDAPLTYEATFRGQEGSLMKVATGKLESYYREHPESRPVNTQPQETPQENNRNWKLNYDAIAEEQKEVDDKLQTYRDSLFMSDQEDGLLNQYIFDVNLSYEKRDPLALNINELFPIRGNSEESLSVSSISTMTT